MQRAGSRAPGGAEGQGCAIHRAPAPRDRGALGGGVSGDPPGRGSGRRRRDVAGLWAGSRSEPSRSARPGPQGRLSSEAVSQELHPEGRRAAAAARRRLAGGQDRPAGAGRGVGSDLRAGLPRFLLRVPAGAFTASSAGRACGRNQAQEGELGARRGHPRLLGVIVTLPQHSWGSCRRGWFRRVGPVFAGLFVVRCGRERLAARRA